MWWGYQSPVAHSCTLLNHLNSFHTGMFKLNAKFDADSLLYSLKHFGCDGHTVHMLTQRCLLPPLTSTVKSSLFTHPHSNPLSWLPGYINVTQTVLILLTMVGSQQSMGDNEPKTQGLSQQVQETAPGGQWRFQHLSRKGQSHRLERVGSASTDAEPPAADAKGDQCAVEQHCGMWSSAVSAVVWGLPPSVIPLRVVYSTLLGLLISVSAPCWWVGNSPRSLPLGGSAL